MLAIIKIQQLSWLAVFYIPNLQLPVVFLSIKLQKNFRFVIRSSSRCLIYKVQCSLLAFQHSSFIIISPNRKLVKKFFQLFSSFGSIRCDDFSSATFIVYHDFLGLSRTFSFLFQIVLSWSLISQRQLVKYITAYPPCQELFSSDQF